MLLLLSYSSTCLKFRENNFNFMEYPKSDYKEYPKTLAPNDFWGQVRRTHYGKPVSEDQILMMVNAIKAGLELTPDDVVLDIACGNGALSHYLFESCKSLLGVDHSEYLIEVAKKNFEKSPHHIFQLIDAIKYVQSEATPQQFTKALCYGSFSFLDAESASSLLFNLSKRFSLLKKVYIGNLPDKDRAHLFYKNNTYSQDELSDPVSQIGIWRTKEELELLTTNTGWKIIRFHYMPQDFFSSHYRFDIILERAA